MLVGTKPAPAGSITAGHDTGILGLYVGQRPDGVDRFTGALDEVRVFDRALTGDEVSSSTRPTCRSPTA